MTDEEWDDMFRDPELDKFLDKIRKEIEEAETLAPEFVRVLEGKR